jgi:nanoRNase/pAp phosphatase (c-di-AMP/oligoRNAs hydrolase)
MGGPDMRARVDALLDVAGRGSRVLVCTHDNPDPDSIAAGYALGELLRTRAKADYTLAHGGVLGRAENRAMVRLLKIPLQSFARLDPSDYDVVALVDTQPGHGNHRLTRDVMGEKRLVCLDHHPARTMEGSLAPDFADVGGAYGATSTMLTCYLDAAGLEFAPDVATALFYGIKSDTRDLGREVGDIDVWAYQHLISHTDMGLISQIEHPRLPRNYFAALSQAVRKARCIEDAVVCDLGEVYVPDLVAETADWLLLAEGIRWSIVTGEHNGAIFCSLRVSDRRFSAGKLVREAIASWPSGSAGGHGSMAGARVDIEPGTTKAERALMRKKLLRQIVKLTGIEKGARPRKFAVDDVPSDA